MKNALFLDDGFATAGGLPAVCTPPWVAVGQEDLAAAAAEAAHGPEVALGPEVGAAQGLGVAVAGAALVASEEPDGRQQLAAGYLELEPLVRELMMELQKRAQSGGTQNRPHLSKVALFED